MGSHPFAGLQKERGFTLLEVLIAAAILSGILLISFRLIAGAQNQYGTSSIVAAEEMRAEDLLRTIVDRARNGGIASLTNAVGLPIADGASSSNGFRIRLVTGYSGGPVYGETVGYLMEVDPADPPDGEDNDGDGRIDEMRLLQQRWSGASDDPVSTFLETALAEGVQRLTVRRNGMTLEIVVTLERYDGVNNRTLQTVATQTLLMRN